MTRRVDNAFTRGWLATPVHGPVGGSTTGAPPRPGAPAPDRQHGAAMPERRSTFPALRASLAMLTDGAETSMDEGPRWSLQLSPMRLIDAMPSWTCGGPVGASGSEGAANDGASTILLNPQYAGRLTPASLAALCEEACASVDGRSSTPEWMPVSNDCVVLSDEALMRLVLDGRLIGATMVRVDGEVELRDALAIRQAIRSGRPAWQADFRATSVLEVADDRAIALVTANQALAHLLVVENLRQYLAAVLDEEVDTIGWIMPEQVHQLLSISGSILVRAIETDVFSTFVDIGVCTSADEDLPASQAVIYDLPSGSWHSE